MSNSAMRRREENPLRVLVIAVSSRHRAELARKAGKYAHSLTSADLHFEQVRQAEADIILADLDTPEMALDSLDLIRNLPDETGLVALIDNPGRHWVSQALEAGVNAILSREVTSDELHLAFQAAQAGLILLHPTSALDLGPLDTPHRLSLVLEPLTTREQEVLRLMGEGLENKEIARRLHISDHTVKFHISSILGKLGASTRTEAVSSGIRRGLIPI